MAHKNHQEATPPTTEITARQAWMALLARGETEVLESVWEALEAKPEYAVLRAPETGMVMVRARAGGNGDQFNFGEMTVTRCVVRTHTGHMGHAYVAGCDKRHAMLAAVFDGLLQDPKTHTQFEGQLLEPIRKTLADKHQETASKVAATRVDFFTLVRGDN